jgi:putative transposase
MASIDAPYLEDPYSGSGRIVNYLDRDRILISRDQVLNIMRLLNLRAIY